MKQSMWALTYDYQLDPWEKTRGFVRREVPRPVLDERRDPHDAECAILKMQMAGVCGSDRGLWNRTSFHDLIHDSLRLEGKTTRIIGHEVLGEVVELGSLAQRNPAIKPGTICAAESHIICGQCQQCLSGDNHVCGHTKILGFSYDGCFAEYFKIPAKCLWPTDTNLIRPEVGPVQEPFGNAVHCCTTVDLRGKSVAIFGCGTIGLFTILVARAMGAGKIIGIEPDPRHVEMARRLGIDEVLTPAAAPRGDQHHDEQIWAQIRDGTRGEGVDVSLEMYGSNQSVNNAIRAVRKGGHVILFGLRDGDFTIERFNRLIMDGLHLHGVVGRRVFGTWNVTRSLLEARDNGIQDKIWEVILNKGEDTIIPFSEWERDRFETLLHKQPKGLIRFD